MPTLLKVIGGIWIVLGMWVLWRNISALSGVTEAIQPVGSGLVWAQVLSAVAVFLLPGLGAWLLGGLFSRRRVS